MPLPAVDADKETGADEEDFKPLNAQEAQAWRQRHPSVSVWRMVAAQAVVGVLVALVALAALALLVLLVFLMVFQPVVF